MLLRSSLRGLLLVARSRAPAARTHGTTGTSARSFCEAKLPTKRAAAEGPLPKSSYERFTEVRTREPDELPQVYRLLFQGTGDFVKGIAALGGLGSIMAFRNEIYAFLLNDYMVNSAVKTGNFRLPEAERRQLVVREAPLKELKGIVQCTDFEKRSYFVVTGPKGVGKSTLAKMACSDEKGVVLVKLEGGTTTPEAAEAALVNALASAVGFSLPEKDRWDAVRDCFRGAAARFSKEHGRPATLVIDGVECFSASPALMKVLVQFAKTWADDNICRVVFVTSAGSFLDTVAVADRGFSRTRFVHIRGPDKAEAVAFLKQKKGLWRDDRAATLDRVAELAGDRFSWLETCAEEAAKLGDDQVAGEGGVAWVNNTVLGLVKGEFAKAGLTAVRAHTATYGIAVPALKALLRERGGRMEQEAFLALLGLREDLLDALVANNIVTSIQGAVEFQSRAAQFYAEQLPPPRRNWWGLGGGGGNQKSSSSSS